MIGEEDIINVTHYMALILGISDYSGRNDEGFSDLPAVKDDIRDIEKHL